ncbi:hypothetical protein KUTeg_012424 [Tegillarca granosa]|uniref:Uncharacterized protein n=1 Tax=Tegillarca granosa TaxID=220873 RepID=A0ABQ9EZP3_TEGGR|nr:hypothetical protein KUTeg_012424 [Tegillarca granosa]
MYCQFRCFHHHRKLFIEWIGKILALNFYKLIGGFIYSSDFKIFYCNPKFCSSYQFMYARMFTHLFRLLQMVPVNVWNLDMPCVVSNKQKLDLQVIIVFIGSTFNVFIGVKTKSSHILYKDFLIMLQKFPK